MPIRIKCPKCQTMLGVKETLAGKKANCPKCKGLLTIPMPKPKQTAGPSTPPPEDMEALALSAFADEAPKQEVPQFVEFECPFCMETVKVNAALAGKQTPCPNEECKRIIKVPLLKADKPKDWRQMDPRAPIAGLQKGNNDKPLDGAWSSSQKMRVSTDALEEANAIPIKKAPVTRAMWVRRGVLAAVALAVLGAAVWGLMSWRSDTALEGPLIAALDHVKSNTKLKPAAAADVLRGAGEFYALQNQPDKAVKNFNDARAKLGFLDAAANTPPDNERDTVLISLALAMIDLGGNTQEAENNQKLDWPTVQKELLRTVGMLSSMEAKQTALREIGTKLLDINKGDMAVELAGMLAQPDGRPKDDASPGSPLDAQQIAFLLALGQNAEADKIRPSAGNKDGIKDGNKDAVNDKEEPKEKSRPKEKALDTIREQGYAEGKAREGKFDEARRLAKHKGPPYSRLEVSIAVAILALSKKNSAAAKASAQDALEVFKQIESDPTPDKPKLPAWLVIQLSRVCARGDLANDAKKVADGMKEPKDKALAQLELLTPVLESKGSQPVPATMVDEFITVKDSLGYSLALAQISRHNARLGQGSVALATVETLDEAHKPFVQIGVALGQLEAGK